MLDAIRGKAVIVKGSGSLDEVKDAFTKAATERSRGFKRAPFEGQMIDPGEWLRVAGISWVDDPSKVLAVCTRRPGAAHDMVAFDMGGSVGIVLFNDGSPFMGIGSAGRREAGAVAKKTAKLLP